MTRTPGPLSGAVLADGTRIGDLCSSEIGGAYYRAVREGRAVSALVLDDWMTERVWASRYASGLAACPSVDHPAVARVLGVVEEGDLRCVISEHLGESIERAFFGITVDVPCAIALGRCVAEGLCAIHATGHIHGGLSARSIFLPDLGVASFARIAVRDLMPRTHGEQDVGRTITLYGAPPVLGDAFFGAPLDARSDLTSLALTLYQILVGRLGLDHESIFEIYQRYVSGSLVDLRHVRPDVPDALAALLARTYAPDPNVRPQSAREFLDAFEGAAR